MRIILTGGGTGGHLFPLVAVAEKLKEKLGPEAELLYIGSGAPLEKEVMGAANIPMRFVLSGKWRRYPSLKNFTDIFKIPAGFLQSLWILLWNMPDAVFSKGGYAALPVVLAARTYRIPVMIHESDAVPGVANQFLARFAQRIAVAYPSAKEYFPAAKTALVGNPVRPALLEGSAQALRSKLGFTQSKPVLLVLGGSQGASAINSIIVRALPQLLPKMQIIHQTGKANYEKAVQLAAMQGIKAEREGYYPVAFLDEAMLRDAYALADAIVSRAGATAIAESAAVGKPLILIPLEGAANDHQRLNAHALSTQGAAIVIDENNLGQNLLLQKIGEVLGDDDLNRALSRNIRAFYNQAAADIIANGIIELTL